MSIISIPPEERFRTQAQFHQNIRDALQDFVTHFNTQHDEIISKLDPKQAAQFSQWWTELSKCVSEHIDLHDQLASHLQRAGSAYYQLEGEIIPSFTKAP